MKNNTFYDSRQKLEQVISKDRQLLGKYSKLHGEWKQRFIDYMTGKKTLPITYDPFFKAFFYVNTQG